MRKKSKATVMWLTGYGQLFSVRGLPWTSMLSVCALLSFSSTPSWAGGLYLTEFGTPSMGVANAGAGALANDSSIAWVLSI